MTFGNIFVSYVGVLCAIEIYRLGPMDLKIYNLEKKPKTVTRQLTKSQDFRQSYLCDFHLWTLCTLKILWYFLETYSNIPLTTKSVIFGKWALIF